MRNGLKKFPKHLTRRFSGSIFAMSSGRHHKSLFQQLNPRTHMARSVTYSVVPRINPSDKELPPRYYAQAQARDDLYAILVAL